MKGMFNGKMWQRTNGYRHVSALEVSIMTYEELIQLTMDVQLENRYIPLEETPPHCLLQEGGTRSLLGDETCQSNSLGKSNDWFELALCYDA